VGKEVGAFSEYVALTAPEQRLREQAVADIRTALVGRWPAAVVLATYHANIAVPHSVLSASATGVSVDAAQYDTLLSRCPWVASCEALVEESAVVVAHSNGAWVTVALHTQAEHAKARAAHSWCERADRDLPHFRSTVGVLMHLEPIHDNFRRAPPRLHPIPCLTRRRTSIAALPCAIAPATLHAL
jgi:hypothetical protein